MRRLAAAIRQQFADMKCGRHPRILHDIGQTCSFLRYVVQIFSQYLALAIGGYLLVPLWYGLFRRLEDS